MDFILNDPTLSKQSIASYQARVKTLENAFNTNIDDIINNPDTYIPLLNERYTEINTIRAPINTILTILQRQAHAHPNVKAQLRAAGVDPDAPLPPPRKRVHTQWPEPIRTLYNKWYSPFMTNTVALYKLTTTNQPTKRQTKAYMPFADVVVARDRLYKGSVPYLILSLYTMMEPARADFRRMRIYNSKAEADAGDETNFLVITEKQIIMTIREYKTSKTYGAFTRIIPKELDAVIRFSLEKTPRQYLIVSPITGLPYDDDAVYTKYINRQLKAALGKPIGVSMLRHIYVDAQDYNAMTTADKKKLAKNMMHSFQVNDQYRLKFSHQSTLDEEEDKRNH